VTDTTPLTPPPRTPPPDEARSTADLISQAFQQLGGLVRGEISLARAELQDGLQTAVAGLAMMAAALVMVITGLNVLAAAIVAGLAEMGLKPGWAALVVGLLFLVAAAILASIGKKSLDPAILAPNRTARNMRRDAETIKEAATNDTRR